MARMPSTASGAVSWPVRGSSPAEPGVLVPDAGVEPAGAKSDDDVSSPRLMVAPPVRAETVPTALCRVLARLVVAVDRAGSVPPRLLTSVATDAAGAVTVLTIAPRLAGVCTVAVSTVRP